MYEFSIPVEIPACMLATLADIDAVVVRNGIVLCASGELDLGRTTRLANRAQRRALRGLYRRCAIPGCTVAYDRCKLHHVIWWRNNGRNDLDNQESRKWVPLRQVNDRPATVWMMAGWRGTGAAKRPLPFTGPPHT